MNTPPPGHIVLVDPGMIGLIHCPSANAEK